MEINFEGAYTKDLLRRGLALATRPVGWGLYWRIGMIGLTILGLIYAIYLAASNLPANGGRALQLAVSLLILGYVAALPVTGPRTAANSLWRDPAHHRPLNGLVTDAGILLDPKGAAKLIPWSKFTKVKASPDLVVLLESGGVTEIFPRAFFASEADWNKFQKVTSERIKPKP